MEEIIKKCDSIIAELKRFSSDLVYLGPAILDDRLELFEKQVGFKFPPVYLAHLCRCVVFFIIVSLLYGYRHFHL